MKIKERQNRILEILRIMQRIVSINELNSILKVSDITVRRDLQELEDKKAIIRTHGGCMLAGRIGMETLYHKRVATNFELKQSIGKRATQEVKDGDKILIDDCSTTFHLSYFLGNLKTISIYTNSLALITEFSRFPNIKLFLFGGIINNQQYSVKGCLTERTIEQIRFDKVFLGTDGISNSGMCYGNNEASARLTQVMLRQGKEKILLCDHTKIGREAYYSLATLDVFDKWITTPIQDDQQLQNFSNKTKLIIV